MSTILQPGPINRSTNHGTDNRPSKSNPAAAKSDTSAAELALPSVPADSGEPIDRILADELTERLGCHEQWLHASIIAVSVALRAGHTCLYLPRWAGHTTGGGTDSGEGGFTFPALNDWLARLDRLPLDPAAEMPLVLDRQRLYLRRYWRFESELAGDLRPRLAGGMSPQQDSIDCAHAREVLERLFPKPPSGQALDRQKLAAANALWQPVSVIAGGPGTGKTHTVTRLLALLIESSAAPSPHIHLAAPTGKAAQRLAESIANARAGLAEVVSATTIDLIPQQATTIHRLLGVRSDGNGFRHNRERPLSLDILVVDEISMVDLPLMTRLFRALPKACRVVLLGDVDQLPSVAAGSVLADLVTRPHPGYSTKRHNQLAALGIEFTDSELTADTGSAYSEGESDGNGAPDLTLGCADHLSLLHESRRFAGGGSIGQLAGKVIAGQTNASLEILRSGYEDLQWLPEARQGEALAEWIKQHYTPITRATDLDEAFTRFAAFRILCPLRSGPEGVEAINAQIEHVLNPQQRHFFRGQPVMISRNCYSLGLYNGDIGLLWPDDTEDDSGGRQQLLAWFPSSTGYRPIAPARLPEHETAYAMTIHKTQGSEFAEVALLLPSQPTPLLTRELLYTGLTRARERLYIVTPQHSWEAGIRQRVERHSGLAERLR